jgi:acetyl-CoA carboxylase/biotin carboxylase 1
MYNNGVSHKTEARDLDGVYTVLKWLSYMPKVTRTYPIVQQVGERRRNSVTRIIFTFSFKEHRCP